MKSRICHCCGLDGVLDGRLGAWAPVGRQENLVVHRYYIGRSTGSHFVERGLSAGKRTGKRSILGGLGENTA
jgi:hypothetical protein